jgi:hypothetical protein
MANEPGGHREEMNSQMTGRAALKEKVEAEFTKEKAAYAQKAPDERPLGGYLALLSIYASFVTLLGLIVARRRHDLPERIAPGDLALLAVATHKIARVATKDAVTSPFRAKFTRYSEPGGPGEVNEEVRGEGFRHAVGELVTCPFCLGQWMATFLVFSHLMAPRLTRIVSSVFAVVAGSDVMQFAYAKAQQLVE